MFEKIYN